MTSHLYSAFHPGETRCKLPSVLKSHGRASNGQPLWDNLGQEVKNTKFGRNEGKFKAPPK